MTIENTQMLELDKLADELATWFQHPAGFLAGISEKGGASNVPCPIPLTTLARIIVGDIKLYEGIRL